MRRRIRRESSESNTVAGVSRHDMRDFAFHPLTPPALLDASWSASDELRAVEVETQPLVAPPQVLSVPLARRKLRTWSFFFASGEDDSKAIAEEQPPPVKKSFSKKAALRVFGGMIEEEAADHEPAAGQRPNRQTPLIPLESLTRIEPPGDIIKPVDRMYYLLQPPLEWVFGGQALDLPFKPFPFQLSGVAFLYPRMAAILADEMGLGKTMQAITAMRLLMHRGEVRRALLICPKPLVSNWKREFALWAPELPVMVIEGDAENRRWQWAQTDKPLTITNYELLLRDRDLVEQAPLPYDLVALDEAQRIKNKSGATAEVVRSIGRRRSWALTGTPIENHTDDLLGIFEFLAPGYLNETQAPASLGKACRDFVLRREKAKVLKDLPPKLVRDCVLDLTDSQWANYKRAEEEGVIHLKDLGEDVAIAHVFELVLRLKQICNFDPNTGESAKLERLLADIEEIAESGEKAIIFSQWVDTLEELARRLERFGCLAYHGRVPARRRDPTLRQFREDPSKHVILMSYGAGSVGLNLQFCRYVFLYDRWWNPAVEDQAINRAHRIGAAGSVTVTRFLCRNTIEERINAILEEKRELFATILGEADGPRKMGLSQEQLFGLFDLKTPEGPLKKAA